MPLVIVSEVDQSLSRYVGHIEQEACVHIIK